MQFAVDFETYYEAQDRYSLASLGPDAYVRHAKFDPYLVAVTGADGSAYAGDPRRFDWTGLRGQELWSHNARFDHAVYLEGARRGWWPRVEFASWDCTADLAVYNGHRRSLKDASRSLFGIAVDKRVRDEMRDKVFADLAHEDRKRVSDYALDDARLCLKIAQALSWPSMERFISRQTRQLGFRGIRVDLPAARASLTQLFEIKETAAKLLPWVAEAEDPEKIVTPLSLQKLRETCRKSGIPAPSSLAQDAEECRVWEDHYGTRFPWVGAMRDWRRSNIIYRKIETLLSRTFDETFYFSLKYFGAHTGRFAGTDRFNMQNLPRASFFGVDLRKLLVPRPGKVMVCLDLAQIEPRTLMTLIGDRESLQAVRAGISVYEIHAQRTMSWSGNELKKEDARLYALAKARVLSLGYGCGASRFKLMAKTYCDLDLTDDESFAVVSQFRRSNPAIVGLWRDLDNALKWSAQKGEDYAIELPNGRRLTYRQPHFVEGSRSVSACVAFGDAPRKFYGGKLLENLVQAVARDIFVEAVLHRLEQVGYEILFHVHDEVVLECDPDVDTREIENIVAQPLPWFAECPLAGEAKVTRHYVK